MKTPLEVAQDMLDSMDVSERKALTELLDLHPDEVRAKVVEEEQERFDKIRTMCFDDPERAISLYLEGQTPVEVALIRAQEAQDAAKKAAEDDLSQRSGEGTEGAVDALEGSDTAAPDTASKKTNYAQQRDAFFGSKNKEDK